jgi:hypothetical protein
MKTLAIFVLALVGIAHVAKSASQTAERRFRYGCGDRGNYGAGGSSESGSTQGRCAALDRMTSDDYRFVTLRGEMRTKAEILKGFASGSFKYESR